MLSIPARTHQPYPPFLVLSAASHIFKHCWRHQCQPLLRFGNIDDERNGLLLFKPLKHAFDDSRICFEYPAEEEFTLLLLDESLRATTVRVLSKLMARQHSCMMVRHHVTLILAATVVSLCFMLVHFILKARASL